MVAQNYNLPCSCGKTLVVDAGLAGATVTCECGKTVQVPTFRELRRLTPVAQAPSEAKPPPQSRARPLGCLFGALLAIALVSGLIGAGAWFLRQQIDTSHTIENDIAEGNKKIDGMSIDQAFQLWKNFEEVGLGPPEPPPYIRALVLASRLHRAMMIGGAVCGICLGLSIIVAVVDAQKKRG